MVDSLKSLKNVLSLEDYSANVVDLWIPTGIDPIDFIINPASGGIPAGRITQIYGPESAGKSTLLAHIFKSAVEMGIASILFDAENRFDDNFASRVGLDTSKLGMVVDADGFPVQSIESFMKRFYEVVQEFYKDIPPDTPLLVALDSVEALKPESHMQSFKTANYKKIKRQVAETARMWGPWYSTDLIPLQKKYSKLTFIALNQERTNIQTSFFSNEAKTTTPGGRALKFYSSLDLRIERQKLLTDPTKNYDVYAIVTRVKVTKSSVGMPFEKCFVYNHMKKGFDNARSVMWFLADRGVLGKQAGKATVHSCEHFKVIGKVAGKKLSRKTLDLASAQKLYDKYGWDALVTSIREGENEVEQ